MTDGRSITGLSRRRESLGLFGRSRKRPKRYGTGRLSHGRLACEVGNSTCESLRGMQFFLAVEFDVVHLGMHGKIGPGSITRREGRVSSCFLCPKSQRNQFHGRRDPHGSLIPPSFGGIDEIEL